MNNDDVQIVRTSQPGWLDTLASTYKNRQPVVLVDDGGFGIDPASQTLFEMAKHARLAKREFTGVCISLGMSGIGIGMLLLAFFDPEPTSKLGLLVGGGVVCVLTGGLNAIRILTKHKPPNISVSARGIEISWT